MGRKVEKRVSEGAGAPSVLRLGESALVGLSLSLSDPLWLVSGGWRIPPLPQTAFKVRASDIIHYAGFLT